MARRFAIGFAVALCLCPGPAEAGRYEDRLVLGVLGGYRAFAANLDVGEVKGGNTWPESGLILTPHIGYNVNDWVGFAGEFAWTPTRFLPSQETVHLCSYRLVARIQSPFEPVRPFALLGYGGEWVVVGTSAVSSDLDQSVHLGGGFLVDFGKYASLHVEIRRVSTDGQQGTFGTIWEILLGVSARFVTVAEEDDDSQP
jgi:hypothetical protein